MRSRLGCMPPPKGERAARLRAAVAYSGLKQPAAAAKLNVSKETLSRMENGRGTITVSDEQVAAAFGVPIEFLRVGWAPLERPIGNAERRVYELEQQLGDRLASVELLLARQLVADAPPADADQAIQQLGDLAQTVLDAEQAKKRQDKDAHGGIGK